MFAAIVANPGTSNGFLISSSEAASIAIVVLCGVVAILITVLVYLYLRRSCAKQDRPTEVKIPS